MLIHHSTHLSCNFFERSFFAINSMSDTRVLRITGEALKGGKRTTRKGQKGGYDDAPPPSMSPTSVGTVNLMKGGSARREERLPLITVETHKPAIPDSPKEVPYSAKGGKLDLAPKKEKLALVKGKRQQTRKVVKIQMGNLRKSMRRAKDITADSKEKKIEEIEEILVKAGIIRKREGPMSEGKQKTIRDIYRDYLQLRLNAL